MKQSIPGWKQCPGGLILHSYLSSSHSCIRVCHFLLLFSPFCWTLIWKAEWEVDLIMCFDESSLWFIWVQLRLTPSRHGWWARDVTPQGISCSGLWPEGCWNHTHSSEAVWRYRQKGKTSSECVRMSCKNQLLFGKEMFLSGHGSFRSGGDPVVFRNCFSQFCVASCSGSSLPVHREATPGS